jgi:hypothetical protein
MITMEGTIMWKKLGAVVAAIASASTLALMGSTSAHAAPTFVSEPWAYSNSSAAFAYLDTPPLSALLGSGFHTGVYCPNDDRDHKAVIPLKTGLVNAGVLTSACHTSYYGGYANSGSTVATVSLLGGLITVKGIQSSCVASRGTATVGSTLASISIAPSLHFVAQSGGHLFRGLNGSFLNLNDSGFGTVSFGESSEDVAYSVPIELYIAPVYLGHVLVTPAQYIQIGGCAIFGYAFED